MEYTDVSVSILTNSRGRPGSNLESNDLSGLIVTTFEVLKCPPVDIFSLSIPNVYK